MNEETIRAAFAAGPDCLPLEVLARRMDLPAEAAERRAMETHLAECGHCRAEFALLREFEAGTIRPDEKEAVQWIAERLASEGRRQRAAKSMEPRREWWRRLWTPPAMVATLAAAAA